ncbi:hypothetical protein [Bacillus sp. REN10]|uniref:hypothetical protein n=1 Tax=Bacillus sp. REN10 TaxID=2782541 RepID=UPI00193B4B89|nr:hypothetical protein [Bacillus sp. REN10]
MRNINKHLNKLIIQIIVVCMLVLILPNSNQVKAESHNSEETIIIVPKENIADLSEDLSSEFSKFEELDVKIVEANGEMFTGTLVNLDIRKKHEINTGKMQAAAVPVLVYIIGAAVIKATVSKVGKKLVFKIGKKTYQAVSGKAAKKAVATFVDASIDVGSKHVKFTKAKMEHILKNHHPNYWTGNTGKSMFDPDLTVSDIKNIVINVIRSNKKEINSSLKQGKGINVQSKIKGIKYEVRINKDGHVSSAYPVS